MGYLPNTNKWKAKKGELPLYKDKPSASRSRRNTLKMLFKAFVGSLVLWYGYQFLAHGQWGTSSSAARQSQIRQAMLDSWHHYENHGYGYDEFHPVAETGKNMGQKPLGWMVVDSLDTLMIMGADEEVARARKWVRDDLNYHFNYEVNTFETTIRMLGGLIAAFDISGDDVYLDRAVDLANALMGAFESPSGLPYSSVNLETGEGVMNHVDMGASSTAEVATLQLELKYLAKLTGETMFWEKAERVMAVLDANKPEDGLVPIYVHPETGKFQGKLIRLGSRGDSYYEYLLKQYLQTQKQEKVYWDMYRESVAGVKKHLVGSSYPSGLTFIGELEQGIGGPRTPKMDHLVCFYGGLLAVGATGGLPLAEAKKQSWWTPELAGDFKLGEDLTYSCVRMYQDMATGLSPEIVMFNEDSDKKSDLWVKPRDKHNLQRPETVESLFYLWRLTGEQKYRDWGWQIFENFVKYTKVTNAQGEVGFSSIDDVTSTRPSLRDNTESFWWAETLKYLYLLFDDTNMFPLDQYVFNTEAHPFKTFDMGDKLKTGWSRKIPSDREPQMPKPVKPIDKNKPPKAQPVDKSPAQEAEEEIKKNPELAKDHR
ncbi:endoplasmic reticulum mannosyl-oligosaccharide 1,2-alpha-mannosidase [Diutina catenulata]